MEARAHATAYHGELADPAEATNTSRKLMNWPYTTHISVLLICSTYCVGYAAHGLHVFHL